jgi:hypothetical protein
VVGPYAKRSHVSHAVYDHTSILAFLERKWNLQAMTYRDANANDLTDFLDVRAMAAGQPTFPEMPKLAPAGNTPARLACSKTGPGKIPPPLPPQKLELRSVRVSRRLRGLVVELQTDRGTMSGLELDLYRGRRRVAHRSLASVAVTEHRVVLRVRGREPARGRYTLVVRQGHKTLVRRAVNVR